MNITHILLATPLVLGIVLFGAFIVYPRIKARKMK